MKKKKSYKFLKESKATFANYLNIMQFIFNITDGKNLILMDFIKTAYSPVFDRLLLLIKAVK